MSTSHGGNINRFNETLQFLENRKISFTVHSNGYTRKLRYAHGRRDIRFCDSYIKGGFICTMVRRDLDDYIEKFGIPTNTFDPNRSNKFNPGLIEDNLGHPLKAIDCNYFYLQIALNLGYITKKTFDKAISKKEYKEGRLAAIGGLCKVVHIDKYVNGIKVGQTNDYEHAKRYGNFRKNIILEAWKLMEDVFDAFPKDTYMWLTDCAYVNIGAEKKIKEFIESMGYKTKQFPMNFENVFPNNRTVTWYDGKEEQVKEQTFNKQETIE